MVSCSPTNYGQPFRRYSASKNGLTLKYGFEVVQGHLKWRGSIDHVWLSIKQCTSSSSSSPMSRIAGKGCSVAPTAWPRRIARLQSSTGELHESTRASSPVGTSRTTNRQIDVLLRLQIYHCVQLNAALLSSVWRVINKVHWCAARRPLLMAGDKRRINAITYTAPSKCWWHSTSIDRCQNQILVDRLIFVYLTCIRRLH